MSRRCEEIAQRLYFAVQYKTQLLAAYLKLELEQRERVVAENDAWAAVVPFWAVWPFEVLLLPKEAGWRRMAELR